MSPDCSYSAWARISDTFPAYRVTAPGARIGKGAASMTPTASITPAGTEQTPKRSDDCEALTVVPQPMDLLASGVPLSLIIDLLDDRGPNSARILEAEPGDADWLPVR